MRIKVACVGAGEIGRAWAILFARAGLEVALHDVDAGQLDAAIASLKRTLDELQRHRLIADAPAIMARIAPTPLLADALAGAVHAQESVSEDVEVKRALFVELDRLANDGAVLASSTSEIQGSAFMTGVSGRARALVAHPVNPPYLIPVVELCPTPWTDAETVERTRALMTSVGQRPILVHREISGFVLNRLQIALLSEALYLVGEGYCTPEDLDTTVKDGLGLRWSFMGPFETGHLNAPGGYLDYMTKFGEPIHALAAELKADYTWTRELIARIDGACRNLAPGADVAERQRWRDARLMALTAHKARAARELG